MLYFFLEVKTNMSIIKRIAEAKTTVTLPLYLIPMAIIAIVFITALLFPGLIFPSPVEEIDSYSPGFYYKEFLKVNEECGSLDGFKLDNCITTKALALWDSNLCRIVMDKSIRTRCIAVLKKDKSLCNEIASIPNKELCISQIDDYTLGLEAGIGPCNQPRGYRQDFCIHNEAIEKKEIGLCKQISNEPIKLMCVAVLKVDRNLCQEIPEEEPGFEDESLRESCLLTIDNIEEDLAK